MQQVERPVTATFLFLGWLFFLVATLHITQFGVIGFPFVNIDEHAHYSYTLELLRSGRWWPDFNHFLLYDATSGQPTEALNYLNHPPTFYWLMELVQRIFPDINPIHYRLVPFAFYLAAMGIYARLGYLLKLPRIGTAIYVLLPPVLYVPLMGGYYSNDGMAVLGGMLASLGSFHWFSNKAKRGFLFMAIGIALASVKLTAFMLTGAYVALALIIHCAPRRELPRISLPLGILWCLLCALPYLYLWMEYGSPVPNTPGQIYMLTHKPEAQAIAVLPRLDFLHFVPMALGRFFSQFATREMTPLALIALIFSYGYFLLQPDKHANPVSRMMLASLIATLIVLAIHLVFSYQRYLEYGWLRDSLVRYYFPLLPAYGAAIGGAYASLRKKVQ